MANVISYISNTRDVIDEIFLSPGQIMECIDTGETFYDTDNFIRIYVENMQYLDTYADKDELVNPLADTFYLIRDGVHLYYYTNSSWLAISQSTEFEAHLLDVEKLIIATLQIKGKSYAPRTITSAISTPEGDTLDNTLNRKIDKSDGGLVPGQMITLNDKGQMTSVDVKYNEILTADMARWMVTSIDSNLLVNRKHAGGAGNTNSAIIFGGEEEDGVSLESTERFDGISWKSDSILVLSRKYIGGVGTVSAALAAGSTMSATTEFYNGSVWENSEDLSVLRYHLTMNGSSNNAIVIGGRLDDDNLLAENFEKFDGNTWQTGSNLLEARYGASSFGDGNLTVVSGGIDLNSGNPKTSTEKFDGLTWSIAGNTISGRMTASGIGQTYNNGVVVAGYDTIGKNPMASSETYNLNTNIWTSSSYLNLSVARTGASAVGKYEDAIIFGGTFSNSLTERLINRNIIEWIDSSSVNASLSKIKTWSIKSDTIPEERKGAVAVRDTSSNTATSLIFGGINSSDKVASRSYKYNETNGFSNTGNSLVARYFSGGAGTVNSALSFGGTTRALYLGTKITETFSGNSWKASSDMLLPRDELAGFGVSSSAMAVGGISTAIIHHTSEAYNGTTWSISADLSQMRFALAGSGVQNNAIIACGYITLDGSVTWNSEKYNGTVWSAVGETSMSGNHYSTTGTGSNAIGFGGNGFTEKFDGFVWSNTQDMLIVESCGMGSSGTPNNTLGFGGYPVMDQPRCLNYVQEYVDIDIQTILNNKQNLIVSGSDEFNTDYIVFGDYDGKIRGSRFNIEELGRFDKIPRNLDMSNEILIGGQSGTILTSHLTAKELPLPEFELVSAGPLTSIDRSYHGSVGSDTLSIIFGGESTGSILNTTEEYNGAIWSNSSKMLASTVARFGSCGLINSAIIVSGIATKSNTTGTTSTQKYNGTAWSVGPNASISRYFNNAVGTSNSAISAGGRATSDKVFTVATENFNGTVWSAGEDMIYGTSSAASAETKTFIKIIGGEGLSDITTVLNFNKYAWSVDPQLLPAVRKNSSASSSKTNLIVKLLGGGNIDYAPLNESILKFNNKIWSISSGSLLTVSAASAVTSNSNGTSNYLTTGNKNNSASRDTQKINTVSVADYIKNKENEFNSTATNSLLVVNDDGKIASSDKTIDDFVPSVYTGWYISAPLNTARAELSSCGSTSDTIAFGGRLATDILNSTEQFNGNVWNNTSNLNVARKALVGVGVSNNTLAISGTDSSSVILNTTEKYNGLIWTSDANTNIARSSFTGVGNVESSIIYGGRDVDVLSSTETFNGTIWSQVSGGDLLTKREFLSGAGVFGSALAIGGSNEIELSSTEKYNSAVWTADADITMPNKKLSACGITNDAILFGGISDSKTLDNVEIYNGITWNNIDSMSVTRHSLSDSCDNNVALAIGGSSDSTDTGSIGLTEKFNKTNNSKGIRIVDDCNCPLPTAALSARQGSILREELDSKAPMSYPAIWSISADLNIPKQKLAGSGDTNNALAFGGINYAVPSITSEMFNSTVWVNIDDMNNPRTGHVGCGTSDSTIAVGGGSGNNARSLELYNGTTWSNVSALLMGNKINSGISGISNSAIVFGGSEDANNNDSPGYTGSEIFNGTGWTAGGNRNMNIGRHSLSGCGTLNNTLAIGGRNGTTLLDSVEKFDGNSWKLSANLNATRYSFAGCGSPNGAIVFGGATDSPYTEGTATSETFNGIVWSNNIDLNKAISRNAGCGNGNNALSFGGGNVHYSANSEKFRNSINITDIINSGVQDTAFILKEINELIANDLEIMEDLDNKAPLLYNAWSISTSMNTIRLELGSCGATNINAIAIAGFNTKKLNTTERYNGNNWYNTANLAIGRFTFAVCGISNNTLAVGGNISESASLQESTKSVESFNGSIWSSKNNLNTERYSLAGCGASNDALIIGGCIDMDTVLKSTEKFNGTTWSNSIDTTTARQLHATVGASNDAIVFGGMDDYERFTSTERFNGTVWSTASNINTIRTMVSGCGKGNDAFAIGGVNRDSETLYSTEKFNGTIWSMDNNMNIKRDRSAGAGTTSSALITGGNDYYSNLSSVENYNMNVSILDINKSTASSISALSNNITNYDTAIETLEDNYDNINTSLGTIQTSVTNHNTKIGTLETNYNTMNGSLSTVSGKVGTLETNYTAMNGSLTATSGKVGTLETNYNTMNGSLSTVSGKVGTLETNYTAMNNTLNEVAGKVENVTLITTVDATVTVAAWGVLASQNNLPYANIGSNKIKSTSVVNVNFKLASINNAEFFGVYGITESHDGYVRIYADAIPNVDLSVTLVIM